MTAVEETRTTRKLGRFSSVQLLVALVSLFFIAPFVEELQGGQMIVTGLVSLVLLSSVIAVSKRRTTLVVALVLAFPALTGRWLHLFRPALIPHSVVPIIHIFGIALILFVILNLLRFTLTASEVDLEVLSASISAYLLLGLLWALLYWLVTDVSPGSFAFNVNTGARNMMTGVTAFYFSFVTLSTAGYGDITPVSNIARMLAAMEAITGPLYLAVLLARLVSLYSASKSSSAEERDQ